LVEKYGTKNWRIIASNLPGRLPKQCRERWINHLDPGIIKGKLTEAEWNVVLESQEELGNKWSEIAKLLPGRTPNQIKNVWHAMARKGTSSSSSHSSSKQPKVIHRPLNTKQALMGSAMEVMMNHSEENPYSDTPSLKRKASAFVIPIEELSSDEGRSLKRSKIEAGHSLRKKIFPDSFSEEDTENDIMTNIHDDDSRTTTTYYHHPEAINISFPNKEENCETAPDEPAIHLPSLNKTRRRNISALDALVLTALQFYKYEQQVYDYSNNPLEESTKVTSLALAVNGSRFKASQSVL